MGLKLNFMRGKQMIVHDPRLNNPKTAPPTLLKPPDAFNVWTISLSDTLDHIIDHVSNVARANTKLDALHFMAHGAPSFIELGASNVGWANVTLFDKLKGLVGCVVIFSCSVGSGTNVNSNLNFGNAVATYSGGKCLACYATQWYTYPNNIIDFGKFEGTVYIYHPNGGVTAHNCWGDHNVNLETVIFVP